MDTERVQRYCEDLLACAYDYIPRYRELCADQKHRPALDNEELMAILDTL